MSKTLDERRELHQEETPVDPNYHCGRILLVLDPNFNYETAFHRLSAVVELTHNQTKKQSLYLAPLRDLEVTAAVESDRRMLATGSSNSSDPFTLLILYIL